ncbi:hypothetical protein WR25_21801 [Diploscapter pachys]|uniref:Major sperm protein n=1 Tax=Diploscapter pachys TaxID=2018661 RepID=A0A2A2L813_9BILA|nr:hypothetical protein WR25_21801 [Diploscapter pachys]
MLALGAGLIGPVSILVAIAKCSKKRGIVRPNNAKSTKGSDSKHAPGSASARRSAKSKKSAQSRSNSEKSKDSGKDYKSKSGKGKIAGGFMRTTRSSLFGKSESSKSGSRNKPKTLDNKSASADLSRSARPSSKRASMVRAVDVKLTPTELNYKPIGGLKEIQIANDSAEKRAFKVKCSDNLVYRISPVYGLIEPGKSVKVDVLRQNGGVKMDKLVIVTAKATSDDANPKACFERSSAESKQMEMMVLPLVVQE